MFPLLSLLYTFRLLYSDCALRTCVPSVRFFIDYCGVRISTIVYPIVRFTCHNLSIYYTRTNGMASTKSGIQDVGSHDMSTNLSATLKQVNEVSYRSTPLPEQNPRVRDGVKQQTASAAAFSDVCLGKMADTLPAGASEVILEVAFVTNPEESFGACGATRQKS